MVGPAGTGHVHGLNTVEGLPPAEARYLEDVFFQIADDGAARVLRRFLQPPPWNLTPKQRSAWSRFIMALLVRNPESLEKYKKVAAAIFQESLPSIETAYAEDRKSTDPTTYAEYADLHGPNPAARTIVRVIQHLADNPDLGRQINGEAVEIVNDCVASQARKYVYGTDDKQLAFVSERLGRKYTADPTENLSHDQLLAAARAGASRLSGELR